MQILIYLFVIFALVTPVSAGDFQYIYDGLDRLVRVIDGAGNVITYEYDEVGNILSISRTTVGNLPGPSLTSVTPDRLNQTDTVLVEIRGTGLLAGSLTSSEPGLTFGLPSTSETLLRAEVTVSATATLGPAILTVTTPVGADTIPVTILIPHPRIISIVPNQGTAAGGNPVTIMGTGFTPGTGLKIGGATAANVQVVDALTLTAMTPSGVPGPPAVDVEVSNSAGADTLPGGFLYTFPFQLPDYILLGTMTPDTLRITLTEPAAGNLTFDLASSNPGVATLPNSVTILQGEQTGQVSVTPVSEGSATATVTLGAASDTSTILVGSVDTDGDGLPDVVEIAFGTLPDNPDSDGDGILDGDEDPDLDGLTNKGELVLGTNPANPDTDGDGILDGAEDDDVDGLTSAQEVAFATNPFLADTDGDTWPDGAEIDAGSNPRDPNSRPTTVTVARPPIDAFLLNNTGGGTGGLSPGVTVANPPVTVELEAQAP